MEGLAVAWSAEIGVRVRVTPQAEVVGRVVGLDPVGALCRLMTVVLANHALAPRT